MVVLWNANVSAIPPIIHGLIASPNAWIMKIVMANAIGLNEGGATFKRIAFVGPVFKKVQKQARKINIHANGKGM